MREVLISAVVAAAVCFVALQLAGDQPPEATPIDVDSLAAELLRHPGMQDAFAPRVLNYSVALVEDGWVNGAGTAGTDYKPLEPAANSICYLTKIEIGGIQGPGDRSACSIEIDEFTAYWQLLATVPEGSRAEVRCNARCLVWE